VPFPRTERLTSAYLKIAGLRKFDKDIKEWKEKVLAQLNGSCNFPQLNL
jgi:hypothetical protein